MSRQLFLIWILLGSSLFVTGCGKSDQSASQENGDGNFEIASLLEDIDLTEGGPNDGPADKALGKGQEETFAAAGSKTETLQLQLTAGDQFSLVKTVTQNLVQKSADAPAVARSQLELHMDISVEEVTAEHVQLTVLYRRVAYSHDVNGQQVDWDSATHQGIVPAELSPYAGMVNNGFSFRLGMNNQIREVIGYDRFLQRCVQNSPAEKRDMLLAQLGNSEVAGFVDDSIGLLPYDVRTNANSAAKIAVGDQWSRNRKISAPTPVNVSTTCRLLSLTKDTAEITLSGRMTPDNATTAHADAIVQIIDGRSSGSCIVDRKTGLPLESNRNEFMNLRVRTGNGGFVEQEKQVKTTIRATGTTTRGPIVSNPRGLAPATAIGVRKSGGVTNVSGQHNAGGVSTISTQQEELSSTATAHYPPD